MNVNVDVSLNITNIYFLKKGPLSSFFGSQTGIKFATPILVVPTSKLFKKSNKVSYQVEAKITKFELGGGLKLIIHKIKLCS